MTVPRTYEQPAIARRVEWTGCGTSVPLARLNTGSLKEAMREVIQGETYRAEACRISVAIAKAGGVQRAADLIETAVGS